MDEFTKMYTCDDPECEASHVDWADVPVLEFREVL